MKELVIGLGFIGTRLREMTNAEGATRGNPIYHPHHVIDLLNVKPDTLPTADLVYITAGINGQAACEGNPKSWLTNCDGTISITREYTRRGSWVVWLSSSTVEWASSAYARQKAFTESVLLNMDCSIIRPGRVTKENLEDLCTTIINAGRNKWPGITRWGEEAPYVR